MFEKKNYFIGSPNDLKVSTIYIADPQNTHQGLSYEVLNDMIPLISKSNMFDPQREHDGEG
jgi:hypothetical protein